MLIGQSFLVYFSKKRGTFYLVALTFEFRVYPRYTLTAKIKKVIFNYILRGALTDPIIIIKDVQPAHINKIRVEE
jgi:hypothetical protein